MLACFAKNNRKRKEKKHNYTSETGRVFCSPAGIWFSRAGGGAGSGAACWSGLASRVDTALHHSDPDMGEQVTEVVQKRLNQSTCCSENTTKKPHISWGPRTPSRKQHFLGGGKHTLACLLTSLKITRKQNRKCVITRRRLVVKPAV